MLCVMNQEKIEVLLFEFMIFEFFEMQTFKKDCSGHGAAVTSVVPLTAAATGLDSQSGCTFWKQTDKNTLCNICLHLQDVLVNCPLPDVYWSWQRPPRPDLEMVKDYKWTIYWTINWLLSSLLYVLLSRLHHSV